MWKKPRKMRRLLDIMKRSSPWIWSSISCTPHWIAKVFLYNYYDLHLSSSFSVAFTAQQIRKLTDFAHTHSLPLPDSDLSGIFEPSSSSSANSSNFLKTPSTHETSNMTFNQKSLANESSLDDLAREFGVDAHVVQALAQRLAKMT